MSNQLNTGQMNHVIRRFAKRFKTTDPAILGLVRLIVRWKEQGRDISFLVKQLETDMAWESKEDLLEYLP